MPYYHAAPAKQAQNILAYGLVPAIDRYYSETTARVAWLRRWANRTGRSYEACKDIFGDSALDDIRRICVFKSLDVARAWAARDQRKMVIFEIDEEEYGYGMSDDQSADIKGGETGALSFSDGSIDQRYIKIVA